MTSSNTLRTIENGSLVNSLLSMKNSSKQNIINILEHRSTINFVIVEVEIILHELSNLILLV